MRTGKLVTLVGESMVMINLRFVGQCNMLLYKCLISNVAQEYDYVQKSYRKFCSFVGCLWYADHDHLPYVKHYS